MKGYITYNISSYDCPPLWTVDAYYAQLMLQGTLPEAVQAVTLTLAVGLRHSETTTAEPNKRLEGDWGYNVLYDEEHVSACIVQTPRCVYGYNIHIYNYLHIYIISLYPYM